MRHHTDPWLGWQGVTLRLAIFLIATIIGAIVLIPLSSPFGLLIWVALVVSGLLYLVHWHTESFNYRCPYADCDEIFEIRWWVNLISPQGFGPHGGHKYLRCPSCHRFGWAQIVGHRPKERQTPRGGNVR